MTGSLKQSYNMTKPRSIILKNISLGWFLLFYVLAPTKSIATNPNVAVHNNNEAIDHDNANINSMVLRLPRDLWNESIRGTYTILKIARSAVAAFYIVYSTYISLYNYFTGHNKRKSKWYLHKFFLYAGRKINITKNFYLDLSLNLLIFSFYLSLFNTPRPRNVKFNIPRLLTCVISLLASIQLYINIRIYKNFYLSFNLIGAIIVFLWHSIVTDFYNKNSHIINHQVN